MMYNALRFNLNVLESVATSTLSAWRGCLVVKAAPQPEKALTLYDIEGCPYCRRVREALTALHLDADIRPCPKGGRRYRNEAEVLGGKVQFPLLVDENTGITLFESGDIVAYLFRQYGGGSGRVPGYYRSRIYQPVTGSVASAVSGLRGIRAVRSLKPELALHLWSFEGSPFSRLVRERLCELELPYTLHNLGKEHWSEIGPAKRRLKPGPYVPLPGGKRAVFFKRHGRVQVPYLEDPNTGEALFESSRILRYLDRHYAV